MSERVTVHEDEMGRYYGGLTDLPPGAYFLYPAGEGLHTTEEVMEIAASASDHGDCGREDCAMLVFDKAHTLRIALEARVQQAEAEEPLPRSELGKQWYAESKAHREAHPDAYCAACGGAMECPYCEELQQIASEHPTFVREGDVWQWEDAMPMLTVANIRGNPQSALPWERILYAEERWGSVVRSVPVLTLLTSTSGWTRISKGPEPAEEPSLDPEDMAWEDVRRNKPPQSGDCYTPEPAAPLPEVGLSPQPEDRDVSKFNLTLADVEKEHRRLAQRPFANTWHAEAADLLAATQDTLDLLESRLAEEVRINQALAHAVIECDQAKAELQRVRKLLEWVFSALEDMDFAHCDASLVVAHTDISEWLRQHPAAEEAGR